MINIGSIHETNMNSRRELVLGTMATRPRNNMQHIQKCRKKLNETNKIILYQQENISGNWAKFSIIDCNQRAALSPGVH